MWGSLLDGLVVQVALDDPVVDVRVARTVALDDGRQGARPQRRPVTAYRQEALTH